MNQTTDHTASPEDDDLTPLDLLLTPQCRITVLQSALDSLTLQIADRKRLFSPSETRVRLLLDQVRLIGSQIRSYEKLEQLKKDMGLTGKPVVADTIAHRHMHAPDLEEAPAETPPEEKPEKKSAPEADSCPVTDQATHDVQAGEVDHADRHEAEGVLPTTRAERRRLKRAASKQRQKNKPALVNGTGAASFNENQPQREPAMA